MKRVLLVAPHFPPLGAVDGNRARMLVSHLSAFGWEPSVLTVDAAVQPETTEAELLETLPRELRVTRVGAIPLTLSRTVGIGNVALRALPQLYRAGARAIRNDGIDLVYFSTTMFAALPLGRVWKRLFGVPYVIDMQDPWHSDLTPERSTIKTQAARVMHRVLERFTMRTVDGLVAVSPAYLETLRSRYPWIGPEVCRTIPFGAAIEDHHIAARRSWVNPFFRPGAGERHGVALGRGGDDMRTAAAILFRAWKAAAEGRAGSRPEHFWFVGTDYAPACNGRKTIEPVAAAEGLGGLVREQPARIAYLDGLRLLGEADFLIVLGSTDAQYSPSKVYPYLLAGRPIVAVLHESSPVVDILKRARTGPVVTFADASDVDAAAARLVPQLLEWRDAVPASVPLDASLHRTFSARVLAGAHGELFDRVTRMRETGVAVVPCQG